LSKPPPIRQGYCRGGAPPTSPLCGVTVRGVSVTSPIGRGYCRRGVSNLSYRAGLLLGKGGGSATSPIRRGCCRGEGGAAATPPRSCPYYTFLDFTGEGLGYRYICLNLQVGWTIESESGDKLHFVTVNFRVKDFDKKHVRTHICEVQLLLRSTYDLKIGGCHDNFVRAPISAMHHNVQEALHSLSNKHSWFSSTSRRIYLFICRRRYSGRHTVSFSRSVYHFV